MGQTSGLPVEWVSDPSNPHLPRANPRSQRLRQLAGQRPASQGYFLVTHPPSGKAGALAADFWRCQEFLVAFHAAGISSHTRLGALCLPFGAVLCYGATKIRKKLFELVMLTYCGAVAEIATKGVP